MKTTIILLILLAGYLKCEAQLRRTAVLLNGKWNTKYIFILKQTSSYSSKEVDSVFCSKWSMLREARESYSGFTPATTMKFDAISSKGCSFSNFSESKNGRITPSKKPINFRAFTWQVRESKATDSLFLYSSNNKLTKYSIIFVNSTILSLIDSEGHLIVSYRANSRKRLSCQDISNILKEPLKKYYFN